MFTICLSSGLLIRLCRHWLQLSMEASSARPTRTLTRIHFPELIANDRARSPNKGPPVSARRPLGKQSG